MTAKVKLETADLLKLYELHQQRLADLETWRHRVTVTTFVLLAGLLLGWHRSNPGEDFFALLSSGNERYLVLILIALLAGHFHCAWSQRRATVAAVSIRNIQKKLGITLDTSYYRIYPERLAMYFLVSNVTGLIIMFGLLALTITQVATQGFCDNISLIRHNKAPLLTVLLFAIIVIVIWAWFFKATLDLTRKSFPEADPPE